MNNNLNQQYIQEDEIDLRELWKIIISQKKFIILFTSIITIGAVIFAYTKNPTPIYSGNMMIEIGEVKSNNPNQTYFDNAYALKNIIEKQYDVKINLPKKANSINNTNNILTIIVEDTNKENIKNSLTTILSYTIERHKSKVKLYDKYIMTKQIGKIVIENNPINTPKRKLIVIVSFVTSLILSIFKVFFIDFIRKDENTK